MTQDKNQQQQPGNHAFNQEELEKLEQKHAAGDRKGNSSIPMDDEVQSDQAERGQQGAGRLRDKENTSDISQVDRQEGEMNHGEKGDNL